MRDDDTCNICGDAQSKRSRVEFGPLFYEICAECLRAGAEPWSVLVWSLAGVTRESVADWLRPVIAVTCERHNKSEDQFWADVHRLTFDLGLIV